MWILVSEADTAQRHELLSGREYMIGRKDCDILIENDMSISRKHAAVSVSHPEIHVPHMQKVPILTFHDKSRLGSLVDSKRITQDSCAVNDGTVLVFGSAGVSKYRVVYEPFITTTSCLDSAGKKTTRQLIGRLGGHMISEWKSECDLLLMDSLSITIKAICALIAQKPIVTPQYIQDLISAIEGGTEKPNTDDYLPPLGESQLDPSKVSFKPDVRRKLVFQGRLFFFLTSKQFKKLSIAVELAGGTPMLLEEQTDDNKDMLMSPGSCVMSCDPTDQSQNLSKNAQAWVQYVQKTLNKQKKRMIQESEIGYAVLYCTADKYCNPDAEAGAPAVNISIPGQTLSQIDVSMMSQLRAQDTQTHDTASEVPTNPRSAAQVKAEPVSQLTTGSETPGAASNTRKRLRDVDDEEGTPAKRTATTGNLGRGRAKAGGSSPVAERRVSPRSRRGEEMDIKREVETPQKKPDVHSPNRRTKRSPSPAPQSPKEEWRNTRKKSPSPTPVSAHNRRRDTRKNSASPGPSSPREERANGRKNSPIAKKESSKVVDWSDEDTLKGARVKQETNRRRRRKQSSSDEEQVRNSDGEEDDLFSFPSRKSKGKPPSRSAVRRRSPSPVVEDRESTDPGTSKSRGKSVKARPEDMEDEELLFSETEGQEEKPTEKPRTEKPSTSRMDQEAEMTGFLTTTKPTKDQAPIDKDIIYDKALPSNVVVVEEASLMVRRPGQPKVKVTPNKWQGKVVKNFKKFKKMPHAGHALPMVIGGNDLIAHDSSQRKDLELWFKDCLENETQHSQAEKEAQDLFNFGNRGGPSRAKPKSARGRRR